MLIRQILQAMLPALIAVTCIGRLPAQNPDAGDRLTVHEWGTFTELQNEAGTSLHGINTDDEPVPRFVHGFGNKVLNQTHYPQGPYMKSLPYRHYQITTRLETPVVYFYPPSNQTEPMTVDVEVGLRDGWLSEFYPRAEFTAPGLKNMKIQSGEFATLKWNNLRIGTQGVFPETQDPVWLNPRATRAATVTTNSGESEKYLFYRGVGSFVGPVATTLDRQTGQLEIISRESSAQPIREINRAWLVHVDTNGTLAFKSLGSLRLSSQRSVATFDYRFEATDFHHSNLQALKTEMHAELVNEGLFADEASAMLATWNRAYFQSPGLRLFYLVPRKWTDDQMPLTVSVQNKMERVMMGRIELISDSMAQQVQKFKKLPVSDTQWFAKIPASSARNKFFAGRTHFGDLGVKIPADYQAYLDLGRFRNAILRAEQEIRPTQNLGNFLRQYRLTSPKFAAKSNSKATTAEQEPRHVW